MSKLKFVSTVLPLASLTFSTKFQPRAELNKDAVETYTRIATEARAKGADSPFPDLRAIQRGEEILVFSGFHRRKGLENAKFDQTKVSVAKSDDITDEEILRLAIKENDEHGVQPTPDDRKHNLLRLLKFKENQELSNVQLAEIIGSSESFVRKWRPVNTRASQVTGKDGRKQKVGKIGKGKKKSVKDKAESDAGAEEEIPDVSGTVGNNSGNGKTKDKGDDAERSLNRVATILAGADSKFKGKAFKEAVLSATLPLSAADLIFWASKTDSQIVRISKLVIEQGWKPRAALAFIDRAVTDKTKVSELHNLAIAGGGVIRNPNNTSKFGETVDGIEDLNVIAWDPTKFKVTVEEI